MITAKWMVLAMFLDCVNGIPIPFNHIYIYIYCMIIYGINIILSNILSKEPQSYVSKVDHTWRMWTCVLVNLFDFIMLRWLQSLFQVTSFHTSGIPMCAMVRILGESGTHYGPNFFTHFKF